jgi:hypothetical protein
MMEQPQRRNIPHAKLFMTKEVMNYLEGRKILLN